MRDSETLTSEYASVLLQRQDVLQAEAKTVLANLDIIRLLSQLGNPKQFGSSALGLMVWPDIDLAVTCPGLTIERTLDMMHPVFAHSHVKGAHYSNDVGHFNPTGLELHDRYYFGVYYHASSGTEWKVESSFWVSVGEHPEPVHEYIVRLLTDETRLSILWIKDVWYRLPTYREQIYSVDIYDAVLIYGVRTPTEFDEYLIQRGKPAR